MGIIDFLQNYGKKKKIETKLRQMMNPRENIEVFSCVPPNIYGDRFYNFLNKNLFDRILETE